MPAEALRGALERFLESCRRPVLLEPGQEPLELTPGMYQMSERPNGLLLEAWNETRTWARRLVAVAAGPSGRLTVFAERLGGARLKLEISDLDRPTAAPLLQRSQREGLRERFRFWLARQYAGWRLEELSTGADLQRTLSPTYARALLAQGQRRVAALAAPRDGEHAAGALTYGLIWLDYLRRREAPQPVSELALFLPNGAQNQTLLRLKWMDPQQAQFAVFVYDEAGFESRLDAADTGNIASKVEPWRTGPPMQELLDPRILGELAALEGFEAVDLGAGIVSLRIHGLPFGRIEGRQIACGVERPKKMKSAQQVLETARELARFRNSAAPDPRHPWRTRQPEAWLESLTRSHLALLDAALLPRPVYGQVLSMAGTQHGVLDLIALGRDGRLAVIELKASEDPNLPLQALDYWMRVEWHAGRGDFASNGYFPGLAVRAQAPRLLLIAPALQFHPTTETILRFFSPAIEVERIGVGLEWRREFRPVSRLRGAERPGLHLDRDSGSVDSQARRSRP
jgi:hypothetical protein